MKKTPKQMGTIRMTTELVRSLLRLPSDAIITGVELEPEQVVRIHFTSKRCPYVAEGSVLPFVNRKGKYMGR